MSHNHNDIKGGEAIPPRCAFGTGFPWRCQACKTQEQVCVVKGDPDNIIYLCTETQHYCLLTRGAVKIKSGPLWF